MKGGGAARGAGRGGLRRAAARLCGARPEHARWACSSPTYGKRAVTHATLPTDAMPLYTHSQMRNQPRMRHQASDGTRPPVWTRPGCWGQSVALSQRHSDVGKGVTEPAVPLVASGGGGEGCATQQPEHPHPSPTRSAQLREFQKVPQVEPSEPQAAPHDGSGGAPDTSTCGRHCNVSTSQNSSAPPRSSAHGSGSVHEWNRYQSAQATMTL